MIRLEKYENYHIFLLLNIVVSLWPPDKSVTENYVSYLSVQTYVLCTQKNHLNEMFFLSTQNTCLN